MRKTGKRKGRPLFATLVALLTLLIVAPPALADGLIMNEPQLKQPEMPLQRAILTYKNGEEMLIVESSFEAEGQSFGWILPVPGVPTEVEATTPGLLDTLALNLGPTIEHELEGEWIGGSCLAFSIIWILLLLLFPAKRRRHALLLAVIALAITYPIGKSIYNAELKSRYSLSKGSGPTATPAVRVMEAKTAGSYDVRVLEADEPRALNDWLRENGFAELPEGGLEIAADYINEGWVFVASRLRREGEGFMSPHPLKVTFPAIQPVYPMRLTALSGSELFLDLFVVSQHGAVNPSLELIRRSRFELHESGYNWRPVRGGEEVLMRTNLFVPDGNPYRGIEHPEAVNVLWDGCTVSRLQGTFGRSESWPDIIFEDASTGSFQKVLFSTTWALMLAMRVFSIALLPVLMIILLPRWPRIGPLSSTPLRVLAAALLGCALSTGIASIAYASVDKVEVEVVNTDRMALTGMSLARALAETLDKEREGEWIDREEVERHTAGYFKKDFITGGEWRRGDSPGNWDLFEDEQGLVIRVYSYNGAEWDVPLYLMYEQRDGKLLMPQKKSKDAQ